MRLEMKIFSLIAAAAALILSACDRHEWDGEDGTKKLYEHHDESHEEHGAHGEEGHGSDGADHGDQHKKEEAAH